MTGYRVQLRRVVRLMVAGAAVAGAGVPVRMVAQGAAPVRPSAPSIAPEAILVRTLTGHGNLVPVVFSPDWRWLASGSGDRPESLWDAGNGSGDVRVWDAGSGALVRTLTGNSQLSSVAFSPDGRWLASGSYDGMVRVWEAGSGTLARMLTGRTNPTNPAPVTSLVFSQDGRWLVSRSIDGTIRMWEVGSGALVRTLTGHRDWVLSVAFSPDGRWLASGGRDNAVRMWEVGRWAMAQVLMGHTDPVVSVAFSPDGLWLSSGSRDTVRVWIPGLDVGILAEHPTIARRLAPKDEFESSHEFAERISEAQREYLALRAGRAQAAQVERERRLGASRRRITLPATAVTLGAYDADRRRFRVTVDGLTTEVEIVPAEARELFQRRSEIVVEAVEQLTSDLSGTQRLNLQLVHPTTLKRYPIGPQVTLPEVAAVASTPAALTIEDARFTDSDGDNRLGAGERAVLQFTVKNTGAGPGQGLRVVGAGTAPIEGLTAAVGRIEPGESKPVTLTLVGGDSLRDGTAALRLEVKEANGFNAPPLAVSIPTLAFRPPQLTVAEVGVEDAQGRAVIRTGQVVTLTLRIRNAGAGRAAGVVADVVPGAGVFLAESTDPRRAVLRVGDLEAGAFRDVRVKAFANAEVVGRFPVEVGLRETTGRFAMATKDLGLTLETPQRSVAQLEVSAREVPIAAATGSAAAPRLASALLTGIPMAKQENPEAIAVIIGNRSYQNAPGVAFAANDAAVMRQYAERALGIRPGNVIYLEDATLTNLQVVFGREGNAEGRLKDLVKPGVTEVFVFYSGHGAPDARAQKAYLMPVDADAGRLALTGFSVDALYANLAALGAKHVTVVLDACFSGATGGGEMLITAASPIGIQVTDPAARFAGETATILAAAGGQQLSNWYPEQRHGLFTYFFLKGLQGSADADADGAVTVGEMKAWLTNPTAGVPYESRKLFGTNREQVPQVWGDAARVIRR